MVEKDYVLGWLLAGIYRQERLHGTWVFKGGTCLKKSYFETYRFSEDLDFTLTDESHLDSAFLVSAFGDVAAWVYDQTGIEIPAGQLRFDVFQNPRNRLNCEGRIYYRGPIAPSGGNLPRIKLDLTADELLVKPPVDRVVAHPYSDAPADGITCRCYDFDEVFAEKLRALSERGRPRDLYDVVNLFRNGQFRDAAEGILSLLQRKCATRVRQCLRRRCSPRIERSWKRTGPRCCSTSCPEIIRFAAANRMCVDLDYDGDTRRIEPYSLRRTKDDNVILHAIKVSTGESRSYRVDRMQGARATSQGFVPKYAVELTPSGPMSNPPTERSTTTVSRGFGPTRVASRTQGPTHVYECTSCGKKFRRKTRDSSLREHKTPDGWACRGRRAMYLTTAY